MNILHFQQVNSYEHNITINTCISCINSAVKGDTIICSLAQFITTDTNSCNSWMDTLPEGSD